MMGLMTGGIIVTCALGLPASRGDGPAAGPARASAQDGDVKPGQKAAITSDDEKAPLAKGEAVPELGSSVMYVLQARNDDYWFGSNDRGVYRYDGKVLVNFTTRDGLVSDRIRGIREDK